MLTYVYACAYRCHLPYGIAKGSEQLAYYSKQERG